MNPSISSTFPRPDQRRARACGGWLTKKAGLVALLMVAAASSWAAGCGGAGLTCDYNAGSFGHYCFAYPSDSSPTSCSATGPGTAVDTCPTANRIGACTNSYGGLVGDPEPGTSIYYSDGGLTAAAAQMTCIASGGTWSM
jgi:hypothetical protein